MTMADSIAGVHGQAQGKDPQDAPSKQQDPKGERSRIPKQEGLVS